MRPSDTTAPGHDPIPPGVIRPAPVTRSAQPERWSLLAVAALGWGLDLVAGHAFYLSSDPGFGGLAYFVVPVALAAIGLAVFGARGPLSWGIAVGSSIVLLCVALLAEGFRGVPPG
jgi:hypothetical protein